MSTRSSNLSLCWGFGDVLHGEDGDVLHGDVVGDGATKRVL